MSTVRHSKANLAYLRGDASAPLVDDLRFAIGHLSLVVFSMVLLWVPFLTTSVRVGLGRVECSLGGKAEQFSIGVLTLAF